MSVPDESYSRLWAFLMKVIPDYERSWWRLFQTMSIPDEGYSRLWAYLMKVIPDYERTWWRLFQTMSVPDEDYSRLWAYLIKVIPETGRAHWIWYRNFYYLINYVYNLSHRSKTICKKIMYHQQFPLSAILIFPVLFVQLFVWDILYVGASKENGRKLAQTFNFMFRYIYDVFQ